MLATDKLTTNGLKINTIFMIQRGCGNAWQFKIWEESGDYEFIYIRSFFDYLPSTASSFCVPCHRVFHRLFSSFRLCSVFAPVEEKTRRSIQSIRHQGQPREAHHTLYRDFNKPYPFNFPRKIRKSFPLLASHAVVFRGFVFISSPGNTSPLKTTAWEAIPLPDFFLWRSRGFLQLAG